MKIIITSIVLCILIIPGCRQDDGRIGGYYYRTDMHEQPSIKPQEAPLAPVEGTVPVDGFERTIKPRIEADDLENPITRTPETAALGKELYNIYCTVCHGAGGKGDGPVAPVFQTPPDITTGEYLNVTDGFIYEVIRDGSGVMPAHYEHIRSNERWYIVNHVRSLQEE